MPPYRLARLSERQFAKIEALENETGLTLVAYEPEAGAAAGAANQAGDEAQASAAFLEPAQEDLPM